MAIDYNAIRDKWIVLARTAVGSSLSQIGPVGSEFAAVIKRRVDGPMPEYPYIDMDIVNTIDEGGWSSNYGIDVDTGELFYETHKQLLINFRCYGGEAMSIMNTFHGYLRQELVQDDLRTNLGGSLVQAFDVNSMPIKLNDKWIESSDFNITFNVVDKYINTDTATSEITTVGLDGELFRDDLDPDPLDIRIDAP